MTNALWNARALLCDSKLEQGGSNEDLQAKWFKCWLLVFIDFEGKYSYVNLHLLGWLYKNTLVQDEKNSKSSAICKILLLVWGLQLSSWVWRLLRLFCHNKVKIPLSEPCNRPLPGFLLLNERCIQGPCLLWEGVWGYLILRPPSSLESSFHCAHSFIQPLPELRSRSFSAVLFFASKERVSAQFSSSFFRTLKRSQTGGTALICKF